MTDAGDNGPVSTDTGPAGISGGEASPLALALGRVGDRWSLLVVDALLGGPRRYGELQEAVAGISTNVLAQRLRHLEHERVVVAIPYSPRPARFSYELTATGRRLADALRLLANWASEPGEGALHDRCGTPLEVRWWCPTCAEVADADAPLWV